MGKEKETFFLKEGRKEAHGARTRGLVSKKMPEVAMDRVIVIKQ